MPPANHYKCDNVDMYAYTRQGAINQFYEEYKRLPKTVVTVLVF